jgi:diacylglycerol kinase (ATP)
MTRYKIILNPFSGGGKGKRSQKTIQTLLDNNRLDYSLVMTERHWHALELTLEAVRDGFDVVVAAGGDGTVNEVINGLIQAKEQYGKSANLGVLCVGRGNDFAGGVSIPYNLGDAVRVLAENYSIKIDIGQVFSESYPNGRFFGNCVGIGFDAMGTIQVAKLPRMGGIFSYLIAILQTIFLYYKAPLINIKYDDVNVSQLSLLVSIMNGHRLGGGFLMAPNANTADGYLDLCIVSEVSKARIFSLIPHFFRGTQMTQPEVRSGKATHITVEALEGVMPVQTDGEILCTDGKFIKVIIHPLKVNVITHKPGYA